MMNKVVFTTSSVSNFLGTINQTYFDPRIQRRSVWKKKNKIGYLNSVLDGHSIHPFILCDVASCLNYCRGLGEEYKKDMEYFQKILDMGYQYISIDGGNRTMFFSKYFDAVPVASMTEEQRQVSNSNISVTQILKMSKSELHKVATRTNEGEPWNEQEKRNSIDGYVSDFIRDVSDELSDVSKLISQISIDRLGDDSLYAYLTCYWQSSYTDTIKRGQVDEMYKTSTLNDTDELNKIFSLLGECITSLNKQLNCKLTKSFVTNLFTFFVECKRQYGFSLKKNVVDNFVKTYYELDEKRIKETYNNETKKSGWAESNRNVFNFMRKKFKTIYSDFEPHIETYFISKDPKRAFTDREKTSAFCEEKISEGLTYMESIDGNKVHADHIIRHTDGGKTTLDNIKLIPKEENLKKSKIPTI